MKNKASVFIKLLKCILFAFGLLLICMTVGRHLRERSYKYDSFYQLEKNTLDYIVLGNSHSYYAVNPVYIYAHSGYRGYNLADEAQDLSFSCYWLREALKTQSPRMVFLDAGSFFYEETSMSEAWKLKEFAAMPFSIEKLKALRQLTDDPMTRIGVLFPALYFHDRWKTQAQSNYVYSRQPTMGCTIMLEKTGDASPVRINPYHKLEEGMVSEESPALICEKNRRQFELMYEMCREHDARLIVYKTPSNNWDTQRKEAITDFLGEYGLSLLDMNETAAINWSSDSYDRGYHLNYWGNCKSSENLGNYIKTTLPPAQENDDAARWDRVTEAFGKWYNPSLCDGEAKRNYYFQWVKRRLGSCIVLAVVNDCLDGEKDQIDYYLRELGLSGYSEDKEKSSMAAVIEGGTVSYERWSDARLTYTSMIRTGAGDISVRLCSIGKKSHLPQEMSSLSSVLINEKEYGLDRQGLNLVIIEKETGRVLTSSTHFNVTDWVVEKEECKVDYLRGGAVEEGRLYSVFPDRRGTEDTQLMFTYLGNGFYQISDGGEMYLTVAQAETEPGCKAAWSSRNGFSDQLWLICTDERGGYMIMSAYNHLVLQPEEAGFVLCSKENAAERALFRQEAVFGLD